MTMQQLLRSRIEQRLVAHSGLTHSEYTVLSTLASATGDHMRLSELRAALGWEGSRLHHQLTRMSKRGLVERDPMPNTGGGRAIEVRVTSEGLRALRKARPHHLQDVRELFIDVLDDAQLEQLGELSALLLERLNPEAPRQAHDRVDLRPRRHS